MLWRKHQFISGWSVFLREEKVSLLCCWPSWSLWSGRPATSRTEENITKVRQIVRENRRLTVRSIAEQVDIDRETVRKILTEDLDIRRCVQKWSQRSSPKNINKEEFLATKQLGSPNLAMELYHAQPTLNIYTGFIPSKLMTNTSGFCYSL